jgi:hypothetical protein
VNIFKDDDVIHFTNPKGGWEAPGEGAPAAACTHIPRMMGFWSPYCAMRSPFPLD